jgi:alpha-beta hydrolase superfamily lysophospholipase
VTELPAVAAPVVRDPVAATETSPPNGVKSVALWLGSSDRPLFAWLDVPDDGRVVGAAVICPSMGLEAAYSTRGLRHLAHRLVGAGWAALRIDYAATGDSAGNWTDPDLVAEWLGSIRVAIDYVRGLGVPRTAVVGLRLGATLAAAELARGGPVDDLVLWDPCATGRAFLREQTAFAAFRRSLAVEWGVQREGEALGAPKAVEEGSVEAPGAMFSAATVADLKPLSIGQGDQPLASRELVLLRNGRRVDRATTERLALPHVESAEVDDQEALFEDKPETPWGTLDRIATWLAGGDGPVVRIALPDPHATAVHHAEGRRGVKERTVSLGPAELFGILSEPQDDIGPSAPTVIFLNTGLLSHHGPDRLWVDLARAWASGGRMRCVRVDLSGIGDSPTRPGRPELRPFAVDALQDVIDIRRAVAGDHGASVVLVGGCSGADHAIESALFEPVASLCVVNPALTPKWFNGSPDPAEAPVESDDRQGWGSASPLLSGLLARFKRYRGMTRWIPNWGWWIVKRWFMTGTPVKMLEQLAQSGVPVLIVAGTGEAGRVAQGEHRRLGALVAEGGVQMEVVPYLEHSLLDRVSRDKAGEILSSYVAGLGADAGPAVGA